MSSSVAPSASASGAARPQVSGIPEQCYGTTESLSNYNWNGATGADDSVCATNFNDITMYCCQQAGGESAWGAKAGSSAAKEGECGLQLCKLPSDKEPDFMYCNTQYGSDAKGQCKAGAASAASSNSSTDAGDKETKAESSAARVGPASAAMGLVFLACLGLSL